ncbi:hypothetical protein K503DRAFT_234294 [Rhizopogon vinicolor AM-OR11-026]|uniref:HAT C-terminal dimerisation domain-containing protein n=1 Tax=Rhizopogon vinicolor AM-OR11-026 TaxID=1314800 RepID=A0A1B7NEB4_9AGAM|nr:hypothetical protein K503DRAFT_234294 [Rhizopogon vinicolor AM-OR11-026]
MKEGNPRLAGLTPREALKSLKLELKEYHKGTDPSNRKIRKHENIRDWWIAAVQKDENAQVLGALAIKLYSVVPVSMADERTVSTITWLNSPTRSRQDIATLKETIQIRQWHRWKTDSTAPKVAPSVKWRDMYATILGKQPEALTVVPPPVRPPTGDTIDSGMDDDTDDGKWLADGDVTDHVALDEVKGNEFEVGDHIDISSMFLLDILSDQPVQATASQCPCESRTSAEAAC